MENENEIENESDEMENDLDLIDLLSNIPILELKKLLEEGLLHTEELNKNGETILHLACLVGRFELIKYLIEEKEMNLKEKTEMGDTLLHFLASSPVKGPEILKYLVEEKGMIEEINSKNEEGEDCCFYAVRNENFEFVKYLIEERIYNPFKINNFGNSLLHQACLNNHSTLLIRFLIEKGCNLNQKNG